MAKEQNETIVVEEEKCTCGKKYVNGGVGGGVYGLAFIGAVIYYFSTATTFWMGVLGFFKALVWPGILIYELFKFLNL